MKAVMDSKQMRNTHTSGSPPGKARAAVNPWPSLKPTPDGEKGIGGVLSLQATFVSRGNWISLNGSTGVFFSLVYVQINLTLMQQFPRCKMMHKTLGENDKIVHIANLKFPINKEQMIMTVKVSVMLSFFFHRISLQDAKLSLTKVSRSSEHIRRIILFITVFYVGIHVVLKSTTLTKSNSSGKARGSPFSLSVCKGQTYTSTTLPFIFETIFSTNQVEKL